MSTNYAVKNINDNQTKNCTSQNFNNCESPQHKKTTLKITLSKKNLIFGKHKDFFNVDQFKRTSHEKYKHICRRTTQIILKVRKYFHTPFLPNEQLSFLALGKS
jgi:hypothetical protein